MKTEMSPYIKHRNEWKNCTRCFLHETRQKVVIARGHIPCEVLFVGEAPGESEDVIGYPFEGPAGKMLDQLIEDGFSEENDRRMTAGYEEVSYAITNLVGCIPRDVEQGGKASEPSIESIKACSPRLVDLIRICKPNAIVCVGSLSRDWMDRKVYPNLYNVPNNIQMYSIVHPAALLRMNVVQRASGIERNLSTLVDVASNLQPF